MPTWIAFHNRLSKGAYDQSNDFYDERYLNATTFSRRPGGGFISRQSGGRSRIQAKQPGSRQGHTTAGHSDRWTRNTKDQQPEVEGLPSRDRVLVWRIFPGQNDSQRRTLRHARFHGRPPQPSAGHVRQGDQPKERQGRGGAYQ